MPTHANTFEPAALKTLSAGPRLRRDVRRGPDAARALRASAEPVRLAARRRTAAQEAGRRPELSQPGDYVYGVRARRRHGADLSLRSAAAHYHRGRVGAGRGRADAADYGAESVSARHLQRGTDSRRRRCAARGGLQLQTFPAPDDRAAGAAQCIRGGVRNGPDPDGRRRVRGARRQPARAQRRELHADQPARDEEDLSAAVSQLQT